MNELKESVGLSSELTVEVLIRGALSLEQRESEKVFQLLKKGLENEIAQRQISNRVARNFKWLKQKLIEERRRAMNFATIKEKMLKDLEWITSRSQGDLVGILDQLSELATTYEEWSYVHWCDWPKEIEGAPVKKSQALLEMARLATTDDQIKECWKLWDRADNMCGNQFWVTDVDPKILEEIEEFLGNVIVSRFQKPYDLAGFMYDAKKTKEKFSTAMTTMEGSRAEWTRIFENFFGVPKKEILDKIFDRITFEELIEVSKIWVEKDGSFCTGSSDKKDFFETNFNVRVAAWLLKNATDRAEELFSELPENWRKRTFTDFFQNYKRWEGK